MVKFKSGKSMIEEYHFGSIAINGKIYHHDVEVRWTGEVLPWWRRESHIIDVEDVRRAVEQNPETIIIGTGEMGIAKVTEEAKKFIKDYNPPEDGAFRSVGAFRFAKTPRDLIAKAPRVPTTFPFAKGEGPPKGIELLIDKTGEAVKTFNVVCEESLEEEGKQRKVIGLFHLTC
ncbi:MAG: hypothetical protein COY73_02630 [Candidatus Nealsonbacteria bacterium CG_4_10_14_0_8_um_filter_37_14]|uniref:Uncharacterized protein n=1 Tax=Candidatus Nealsonbacteria bacterium CG_4_10_14_0_8_um_filter_37_14 TaxID=1974684 RepID=A0A2M7R5W7_9BACT|nr:MAG: hypothetical protein COZ89_01930 [Candidatus Nealsonbacteria bacterium CG_4_8_14_3_um_filter_37_23]PIY88830.1 MAG: hypothetical protein COY73_02630 [Candidatus Nealsonbacteria bacterium CG_4_10_14_0_8_um_filter_37_14]